ncbi:MAG: hypothetical protein LUF02_01010 [Erysipelotrichaceae bacterium]|nr:hypothetical protein [Erysipelotrichaceae bacterium]
MKKIWKFLVAASMVCVLAACSSSDEASGSDTLSGTYSIYVQGDDWGCGVSKAIVTLDYVVDEVSADDFVVTETKQTTDWSDETYPVIETTVDRTIENAYLCDADGNETDEASQYVALELYISPDEGSPMLYSMSTGYNTWSDPYYLTISLSDSAALTSAGTEVTSFTVDTAYTAKTTSADGYSTESYEASDGTTYNYAYYNSESDNDVLVVWLHGAGEGGAGVNTDSTDPYVNCLSNEVTALISEEFQDIVGDVNVVAPQCPTYWMDEDGQSGNYNGGSITITGSQSSYYIDSLDEFIDQYAESIGATKIVLAGDSNGGYMTMVMAIANPDKYTAIVPICEALTDSLITDEQFESLVDLPMYFIYSEADTTVDPTLHEEPTIERLQEAGATNIHVYSPEKVIDTSGRFDDEDGNAYEYSGHWSWIYFDNNETECDDCGLTAWEWIAEQIQ